jgi:hypothetical protein
LTRPGSSNASHSWAERIVGIVPPASLHDEADDELGLVLAERDEAELDHLLGEGPALRRPGGPGRA